MVFSLLLGKTTYSLKVVNLLMCILIHPLLAYSSPLFHHQLTPSSFHPPLANCAFHSPPYGGGVGGGASWSSWLVGWLVQLGLFIPPLVLHLLSLSFLFPPFLSLSSSQDYPHPPAIPSRPYVLAPSMSRSASES